MSISSSAGRSGTQGLGRAAAIEGKGRRDARTWAMLRDLDAEARGEASVTAGRRQRGAVPGARQAIATVAFGDRHVDIFRGLRGVSAGWGFVQVAFGCRFTLT